MTGKGWKPDRKETLETIRGLIKQIELRPWERLSYVSLICQQAVILSPRVSSGTIYMAQNPLSLDEVTLAKLEKILLDNLHDSEFARELIMALSFILGRGDAKRISKLIQIAKYKLDVDLRNAAIRALGDIGGGAAFKALIDLFQNDERVDILSAQAVTGLYSLVRQTPVNQRKKKDVDRLINLVEARLKRLGDDYVSDLSRNLLQLLKTNRGALE